VRSSGFQTSNFSVKRSQPFAGPDDYESGTNEVFTALWVLRNDVWMRVTHSRQQTGCAPQSVWFSLGGQRQEQTFRSRVQGLKIRRKTITPNTIPAAFRRGFLWFKAGHRSYWQRFLAIRSSFRSQTHRNSSSPITGATANNLQALAPTRRTGQTSCAWLLSHQAEILYSMDRVETINSIRYPGRHKHSGSLQLTWA